MMDVGRSINYSVDVGQVEGAFVQGMGLFTIEDVLHVSSSGAMATKGPGAYKIPTGIDVPREFNVSFLKNKEYKSLMNVKKSKGVGEPPLLLAFSVFLALRDAVIAAR
jgi:xanthine dehydrogenase/oxidase